MNRDNLTPEIRKKLAIAHLSKHIEKAPEGLKIILGKLHLNDLACRKAIQAIEDSRKAINELNQQLTLSTGATRALIDLASSMLPDDTAEIPTWADAGYDEFESEFGEKDEPDVVSRNPVKNVGDTAVISHGETRIIKP